MTEVLRIICYYSDKEYVHFPTIPIHTYNNVSYIRSGNFILRMVSPPDGPADLNNLMYALCTHIDRKKTYYCKMLIFRTLLNDIKVIPQNTDKHN